MGSDLIKEIFVDGFKSLRNASIRIKPVTILIGLNSSGKSSILQCLEILKQTAKMRTSSLMVHGELINLGSFKDIIAQKDEEKEKISFEIKGCREQALEFPLGKETLYDYSFLIDSQGLKSHNCSISSGRFHLRGKYDRKKPAEQLAVLISKGELLFNSTNLVGHPFDFTGSKGFVESFNFNDLRQEFLSVIAKDLEDFFIVPAIRGISSPTYPLDNRVWEDIMDSNNLYRQAIKFSSTIVYKSSEIERKINKWISRITGITIRARTVPDKQAAIEASRRINSNIVNEGFGSNQLVHLFTQIATAPVHSLIGIEEPEVHLHPKAQSELSKVLIEIAHEEAKNLIITTHSEHILYRVLIEIARKNLSSDDVAIYHFRISKDGSTSVEHLDVDKKGQLKKGIPDFFETDLDEFKDFLEAMKS
jgi:AAA15 family ATPase/GTPase